LIQLQAELPSGVRIWLIKDTEFTIGRSADCQVQLEHPAVSKIHARVSWQSGVYSIYDAGSSNGIWIDGKPISYFRFDDTINVQVGTVECRIRVLDPMFGSPGFGRFRVSLANVQVGRGSDNDWIVDHPTVSLAHFIIECQGAVVRLRNISRQGTRVGGLPVMETPLALGDEITAGEIRIIYLEAPSLGVDTVFCPLKVTGKQLVFHASVTGVLGRDQTAMLKAYLDDVLISGARTIELDLASCNTLHPYALDILISTARKCVSSGGRFVLVNPGSVVERALALSNATKWLSISQLPR